MRCHQKITSRCPEDHVQSRSVANSSFSAADVEIFARRQEELPQKLDRESKCRALILDVRRPSNPWGLSNPGQIQERTTFTSWRRSGTDASKEDNMHERTDSPTMSTSSMLSNSPSVTAQGSRQRKPLRLYPRTGPLESGFAKPDASSFDTDADTTRISETKAIQGGSADAKQNIERGVDELFVTRDLATAEHYFSLLSPGFHYLFVEKLV
ncbi:uncharacterized protein BT62DRAFT_71305 [Guyanagaster necrorhizus]|uniref:Uncharacterized protein n=1 Tax=Guyanagaster necrorhizus TaxID=856835 RepID=A0A9P8ATQ0_9AGAR|nr:uncharacterized protein BT62DRAFT_71305 [Guyanagaster necrorhizus MCA 3950]KAG7447246.1 hypothetical protein BT62DRAFT_71305 [Guyanagaster necrorhizus MCA 3950]